LEEENMVEGEKVERRKKKKRRVRRR